MHLTFTAQPGDWQLIGKNKHLERLCKETVSFPLLKMCVFYHIGLHMEVKENAQE